MGTLLIRFVPIALTPVLINAVNRALVPARCRRCPTGAVRPALFDPAHHNEEARHEGKETPGEVLGKLAGIDGSSCCRARQEHGSAGHRDDAGRRAGDPSRDEGNRQHQQHRGGVAQVEWVRSTAGSAIPGHVQDRGSKRPAMRRRNTSKKMITFTVIAMTLGASR